MFASMTRKIVTIAAVSLTAATLSLSLVPAAQAGGFSLSFGGGDIAVGVMGGGHMNFGPSDDGADHQKHRDQDWDALDQEDQALHAFIDVHGYNVLLQQKHDCLAVKKIKALLDLMKANQRDGITDQGSIDNWTGQLHDAEKACNKVWY